MNVFEINIDKTEYMDWVNTLPEPTDNEMDEMYLSYISDKTIGEKLREARNCWGFNQKEVAEYLSTSQGQLSRIENGTRKCSPPIFRKLCCLYNIDVEWFNREKELKPLHICLE